MTALNFGYVGLNRTIKRKLVLKIQNSTMWTEFFRLNTDGAVGSYLHDSQLSGFKTNGSIFDQLSEYQLLKDSSCGAEYVTWPTLVLYRA